MGKLKRYKVLFLEDNEAFAKNFSEVLQVEFQSVFHASSIEKALLLYEREAIDCIISDVRVGDTNGLDFIMQIRQINKAIPIVVLSAYKDESFLFQAIGLNILSYEIKPLSYEGLKKLLLQIETFLEDTNQIMLVEDIFYSYEAKVLQYKKAIVELTKKEVYFLELLLSNRERVFTQEEIQNCVWKEQHMSESALKNFLMRLRKKIPVDLISTVNGMGYKLNRAH
jgi:DNA-binding response OmpR family regulator